MFRRGINAGSKMDLDALCAALSATKIQFDDIIDSVHPFERTEEAIEKVWQGKVVGKVVLEL
jgi:Zn-dependent alcohol dehydrogenase